MDSPLEKNYLNNFHIGDFKLRWKREEMRDKGVSKIEFSWETKEQFFLSITKKFLHNKFICLHVRNHSLKEL